MDLTYNYYVYLWFSSVGYLIKTAFMMQVSNWIVSNHRRNLFELVRSPIRDDISNCKIAAAYNFLFCQIL